MRKLPNFIFAGAPKAGSATYHGILSTHPEIYLPVEKELLFFNIDSNYEKGIEWYESFFEKAKNEKVLGECTPAYLYLHDNISRLTDALGFDIKILFSFRNPIDRAYSDFLHKQRRGLIKSPDFLSAIQDELNYNETNASRGYHYNFIERGYYSKYLKVFFENFPRENMLLTVFEDEFLNQKEKTFEKILEFLEVSKGHIELNLHRNKAHIPKFKKISELVNTESSVRGIFKKMIPFPNLRKKLRFGLNNLNASNIKPPKLNETLRAELSDKYFKEEIKVFEEMIDRDLSSWAHEKPSPSLNGS